MKIGDFGLATTETWTVEHGVGSDRYMAPEQFEAGSISGYSPAAADIWAIGICLLNVLFGRNPFASPTPSDPLYADYLRDRQSLFDVFPNMSQDTFDVLSHCLTLDPEKRSLSAMRDALQNVVSFTTDDESLDDFCTGHDVVCATQNRQPLRTPSVSSPHVDTNEAFPWAKALHATPEKATRELSVIHDDDDMFPSDTCRPVDAGSLASAVDSGINMSYKSTNVSSGAIAMPISTSVPTFASRAMASVFGKDTETFSRSWSDLWEEEEEEQRRSSFESDDGLEDVSHTKADELLTTRSSTPAIDIKPPSSRGSSTPRVTLSELSSTNSRTGTPVSFCQRISSHVKHITGASSSGGNSPRRVAGSVTDKWTALGNLRRNNNHIASVKATASGRSSRSPERHSFTAPSNIKAPTNNNKPRDRSGSWRKDSPPGKPFMNEMWNLSKDWRSPPQQNYTTTPVQATPSKTLRPVPTRRFSPRRGTQSGPVVDDIGELEWVGGWNELQKS